MPDARNNLVDLLKRSVVKILGHDSTGSGVWVAPGRVLTCAHVAHDGPLSVVWDDELYGASALQAVPEGTDEDLWPFPDLAVLEVANVGDHPCAWLSDQPVSFDADLVACGYPTTYVEGEKALTSISGRLRGTVELLGGTFLRFSDDEVAPGMSGGPVLEVGTGAVCGLMKAARKLETNLGGLVVPLAGMREFRPALWRDVWRAHDRTHVDGFWARERQALPAPVSNKLHGLRLSPPDEVTLLDLLAQLPALEDLSALLRRALYRPPGRPDDLAPIDTRDVMYQLADQNLRPGELFGPIRLAADLAASSPDPVGRRLREWSLRVAVKVGQEAELDEWRSRSPQTGDGEPIIVVQLEPDALETRLYAVTMWVHQGARTTKIHVDDTVLYPIDEAKLTVGRHLTEQLRRLHGRGIVEFVLPIELFEENFEQLVTGRWSRLGRTNPVVIRDLERLQDPETWHEWRLRWQRLMAGGASTEWLDCAYRSDPDQLDGRIRGRDEIGVVGLTRRLSGSMKNALGVALYAGVPAAVWRRDACTDDDAELAEHPCIGRGFRTDFERRRSEHRQDALPHLVKRLRNVAAGESEGVECHNIVLLWDNPERLPEPFVPLTEPSGF